jgi:hypothetical protein
MDKTITQQCFEFITTCFTRAGHHQVKQLKNIKTSDVNWELNVYTKTVVKVLIIKIRIKIPNARTVRVSATCGVLHLLVLLCGVWFCSTAFVWSIVVVDVCLQDAYTGVTVALCITHAGTEIVRIQFVRSYCGLHVEVGAHSARYTGCV